MVMETENSRFDFGTLEKMAVVTTALVIGTFLVATYEHFLYADAFLVEGLLILACGAFVALGVSNVERRRSSVARVWTDPDTLKEVFQAQRAAQVKDGLLIMVIGAIVTVTGVIILMA